MRNAPYWFIWVLILAGACTSPPEGSEELGKWTSSNAAESSDPTTLYVQSAKHARLTAGLLVLKGVSPHTAFWVNGSEAIVGEMSTQEFVGEWSDPDSPLSKEPATAQLTCIIDGESTTQALQVREPALDENELTYRAGLADAQGEVLPTGDLACDTEPKIFIESRPAPPIFNALPAYDCFRAAMCGTLGEAVATNIYTETTTTSTRCSSQPSKLAEWRAGERWAWFIEPRRNSCIRADAMRYYCGTS